MFFSNLDINDKDALETQWFAIWSVGIPKIGNPNSWFIYHAKEEGDVLSSSYVLHEWYELKELEKMGCSPFDINSFALKRMSHKEGFSDIRQYLEYLNSVDIIVVNQKVAQASSDYEYSAVHDLAFLEQLKYLKKEAYKKDYDVSLGALAATVPFAKDRGHFVERHIWEVQKERGINVDHLIVEPNENELKVAKQFWQRINDDVKYNIFNKTYAKKFNIFVSPEIKNIYDVLMRGF